MSDDQHTTSSAAERVAALNARRAAGGVTPGRRPHAAQGARRATLLASVAAVAVLTGGFALNAANTSASVASATKTVATTATTAASTTQTTTAATTQTTTAAVTTSQGS
jgi:hypothetical protein